MQLNITTIIVIITAIISIMAFNNPTLRQRLMHVPYLEHRDKEYYRLISSGFIHADWMHLGLNMFVLYQFGGIVEQYYKASMGASRGAIMYVLLYIGGIVAGNMYSFYKHQDNPHYQALGASGAVSGIMFAYVIFQPWQKIYLYGIIGIPGIIAAVAYLVYSNWASKNAKDNIGHDAHMWGAIFGFVFTLAIDPSLISYFINQLTNIPGLN